MRILLKDGTTKELSVGAAVTGYVATEITITDKDARYLLAMHRGDKEEFYKYMNHFLCRFPGNRV